MSHGTENAIDDAVRAHSEAEGWPGVVTGWITIVATTQYLDGEEGSGVRTVFPGGGISWPMTLGMVEAARIVLHKKFGDD